IRCGAVPSQTRRHPSGPGENISQTVGPRRDPAKVFSHVGVVTEIRPQRIPALQRLGDAIHRPFLFSLERSEELVPNDQRAGVIFIDILWVAPMVYAVVGGGI